MVGDVWCEDLDGDGGDGPVFGCDWFALCDRPAVGVVVHPVLGDVPVCDRCGARSGSDVVRFGVGWWVNVYSLDRLWGGPEEGGWWYDVGEAVVSVRFGDEVTAEAAAEMMREDYPPTGRRMSVLGGEDYRVSVERRPGADWSNYPEGGWQ